jgi:hypothetical protein
MDVPFLVPVILFGSIAFAVVGVAVTAWVEGKGKY